MGNEHPSNGDAGDENTEGNRSISGDEEDALPLTFCTKEDLIRKLQGIQHLPRGEPCFEIFKVLETVNVICRG